MTNLSITGALTAQFLAKTTQVDCKRYFPQSRLEAAWHLTSSHRFIIELKMPGTGTQRRLEFINCALAG
jgi:hypothetical protein